MAGKKNYIALTGLFHESKTVPKGEKVLLSSKQAKHLLGLKAVCLPEDYKEEEPAKEPDSTEEETTDQETSTNTETTQETETEA